MVTLANAPRRKTRSLVAKSVLAEDLVPDAAWLNRQAFASRGELTERFGV
jgi:hypothetical protein